MIDRRVVRMRFGLDGHTFTLREVGWLFGVSSTRIQQIQARALRRLRRAASINGISDYRIQGGLAE
jgi:RNA polymerase primary sigma factor